MNKKLAACLLALALMLGASCALAASTSKDGLTLTLTLDSSVCAEGDLLCADVLLANDGVVSYQDISITLEIPDTLVPVDGTQLRRSYAVLSPGRSVGLPALLAAVPDPGAAAQPPVLPDTGDISRLPLFLALAALCAAGLARLGRGARRRLLALLLCLAAGSPMLRPACARAQGGAPVTLSVSESVRVMGQDVDIVATIRCTPVYVGENTREIRALYVIEETFPGGYSNFPNEYRNNTALLGNMFSKATPSGLPLAAEYAYRDQTQEEILAHIAALAAEQDEGDVAFFYLTCHGVFDREGKVYTNELLLSDGSEMHISVLADALAAIPGRVIVVLDYCGSGLAIGKSAQPGGQDAYEQFARQALDAFAKADSPRQEDGARQDGSLLLGGKFCVITGASGTQSSWTNSIHGSYLLQWMDSGVMDADANQDDSVSLREMGLYLQEQGRAKPFFEYGAVVHMIPQFYPESGRYPLFVP